MMGWPIGVRHKERVLIALARTHSHHASHRMSLKQFIPAVIVGLLLAALLLWLTLGWLLNAITLPVGRDFLIQVRCSTPVFQWLSCYYEALGNARVTSGRVGETKEKRKVFRFLADFLFQFLKLVPQAWPPPCWRMGGRRRSLLPPFNWDPESRTGTRLSQRTDIKVLYYFHQNNGHSECEAVHTSLPI